MEKRRYSSIQSGIYAGDELVTFAETELFGGSVKIFLPETFTDMPEEIRRVKYSCKNSPPLNWHGFCRIQAVVDETSYDGKPEMIFKMENFKIIYETDQKQNRGRLHIRGAKVKLAASTEVTVVKRQLESPAVVNLCHNLDSLGRYSTFRNLKSLK